MVDHAANEPTVTQGSLSRDALLGSVLPTALLVALIFGTGALLDSHDFLGIGLTLMLYFVAPPVFIVTAVIALFVLAVMNGETIPGSDLHAELMQELGRLTAQVGERYDNAVRDARMIIALNMYARDRADFSVTTGDEIVLRTFLSDSRPFWKKKKEAGEGSK